MNHFKIKSFCATALLLLPASLDAQTKFMVVQRHSGDLSTTDTVYGIASTGSTRRATSGVVSYFEFPGKRTRMAAAELYASAGSGSLPWMEAKLEVLGERVSHGKSTFGYSVLSGVSQTAEIGTHRISLGSATIDLHFTASSSAGVSGAMSAAPSFSAAVSGSLSATPGAVHVDGIVVDIGSYDSADLGLAQNIDLGCLSTETELSSSKLGNSGSIEISRCAMTLKLRADLDWSRRFSTSSFDYMLHGGESLKIAKRKDWAAREFDSLVW